MRQRAFSQDAFSFANASSSGLYFGRNQSCAPTASIARRTAGLRLSRCRRARAIRNWRRRSGHQTRLLSRGVPTSGVCRGPGRRTARGHSGESVAHHSHRETRGARDRASAPRREAVRARRTSARSCSDACTVFFKPEAELVRHSVGRRAQSLLSASVRSGCSRISQLWAWRIGVRAGLLATELQPIDPRATDGVSASSSEWQPRVRIAQHPES